MSMGQYIKGLRRKYVIGTVRERLLARVEVQPNGCWWWTGYRMPCGYGRMMVEGRKHALVHRVSYQLFKGPIPDNLQIDHVCHSPKGPNACPGGDTCPHRRCVNPDHLEPVTRKVNTSLERSSTRLEPMRDGYRAAYTPKEVCPQGHAFTEENTLVSCGRRLCRICRRLKTRERRARLKAALAAPGATQ